jgi:hypothetical protein
VAQGSRGAGEQGSASRFRDAWIQINPIRIILFDELNLPSAIPFLQTLFVPNRRLDFAMLFEVD